MPTKKVTTTTTTTVTEEIINDKKPTETLVSVILDESSSMGSVLDKTINAFNEYVNGIKSSDTAELPMRLTLTKFSHKTGFSPSVGTIEHPMVRILHEGVRVNELPQLTRETYVPDGMTPLYDAIGSTIRSVERQIGSRRGEVASLVIIITDGDENSSKEFNRDQIVNLIKEKEKEGWTFVYLGADQDAFARSSTLGINHGNTVSFASADIGGTMRGVSNATNMYSKRVKTRGMVAAMNYSSFANDATNDAIDDALIAGDPGTVVDPNSVSNTN